MESRKSKERFLRFKWKRILKQSKGINESLVKEYNNDLCNLFKTK